RTPVFWILYFMFVMVAASGLMATAQIAPIAKDLELGDVKVTVFFVTATTLSTALVIGSHRPGEYDGYRILLRSRGLLGNGDARNLALYVHFNGRSRLLHLGRDFQPLSVHLHRHVRHEIRDHERGSPLHREGRGGILRAVRQPFEKLHGVMAFGLCGCYAHEPDCSLHGALHPKANAPQQSRCRR